ncbi:MAG: TrbI/VirB10 family protein [Fusobacteriaceae bacterium]|jgi:type IV secretion system protein VirB10|nr:TrbI/VirB10 family protein [Fusobacteriaceae bacterium]
MAENNNVTQPVGGSQNANTSAKKVKKVFILVPLLVIAAITIVTVASSGKSKANVSIAKEEDTQIRAENPFFASYSENREDEAIPEVKDFTRKVEPSASQFREDYRMAPADANPTAEYKKELLRKFMEESEQARKAAPSFNSVGRSNGAPSPLVDVGAAQSPEDYDQNRQGSKVKFLESKRAQNFYLGSTTIPAISPYELKAGSFIPAVLMTAINSDLPAKTIVALVRENVFDSVTGNFLLIPQGTRVVGTYDSNVTFGQNRLLVIWQRLIFPNGSSLNLENMQGIDLTGKAGLTGKVNNHFAQLLKGVVLASAMGAAAAIMDNDERSWEGRATNGAGEEIVTIGNSFAEKALGRQPTIEIAQGARINISVHSDMILEPYTK